MKDDIPELVYDFYGSNAWIKMNEKTHNTACMIKIDNSLPDGVIIFSPHQSGLDGLRLINAGYAQLYKYREEK